MAPKNIDFPKLGHQVFELHVLRHMYLNFDHTVMKEEMCEIIKNKKVYLIFSASNYL